MKPLSRHYSRQLLSEGFRPMRVGDWFTVDTDIRDGAFPQADRISDLFLTMGGHRPETPALVQEEMFTSSYGVEIRSVDGLSGRVTYKKTGRPAYSFSPEEVDESRHGEVPARLAVRRA